MTLETATRLFRQGDYAAARKILRRLLKSGQHAAAALRLLGYIEGQTENFPAAIEFFSSSLKYDATSLESWYYLGVAHQKLAQHEDAIDAFQEALKREPGFFEAAHNLGLSLLAIGKAADALVHLDKAVQLNPNSFEAHMNRGVALGKLRRHEAELASYEKALAISNDDRSLLENYGNALGQIEDFSRAAAHYRAVLKQHPDFEFARRGLLFVRPSLCDWDDFDEEIRKLHHDIAQGKDGVDPFQLLSLPSTAQEQLLVSSRYAAHNFQPDKSPMHSARRAPGDRIRIAYLSADFHTHATAFLMIEVFELHDRSRFEVTAISIGRNDHSPLRQRLENAFEKFIDASDKSDQEIAQLIADLNIDILVDLKGYTKDARTAVLARRPAPIQISYLGYPGTMGCSFIDYLVADPFVIPEDHRPFYAEKIICLPDTYQPNDSTREISAEPLTRSDVGLADGQFVFCSFNNSYKLNPAFFDIWMRLLSRVDNSVLWLMRKSAEQEANLRKEALRRGISPERLVFASHVDLKTHLRRLQLADLFLDNLPYNAHTTASDALWAGVPLVTCAGDTFAGRVAGSLLTAAGMPELITSTTADYEQLALDLATDRARLGQIRRKLEATSKTSPLFDSKIYTRNLEKAYAAAWDRRQAQLSPDHIFVASQGRRSATHADP